MVGCTVDFVREHDTISVGTYGNRTPHNPNFLIEIRHRDEPFPMEVRPTGFKRFIEKHGFHAVYLATVQRGNPVKVGITNDPVNRLSQLQNANFELLRFHRFWWLAGHPIAARTEKAFKDRFAPVNLRGEWFDVSLSDAEVFVEKYVRDLGTWAVDDEGMLRFWEDCLRRNCSKPPDAPTPFTANVVRSERTQVILSKPVPRRPRETAGQRIARAATARSPYI
jgi:Meiotically Up-regulated Gene 113 (MUG113) protein